MLSLKSTIVAACGFATTALGHGFVTTFTTDGTSNQGFLREDAQFHLYFCESSTINKNETFSAEPSYVHKADTDTS